MHLPEDLDDKCFKAMAHSRKNPTTVYKYNIPAEIKPRDII